MKKVLALVLALVMMLTCIPIASAFELTEGIVYFGPKNDVKANPGDSVSFTLEFKALPTEDIVEAVDPNGTLHIPFSINALVSAQGPLAGIELTEQAKKEGVTITSDPDWDSNDESCISGTLHMPAKYLVNKETIDLLILHINVVPDWEIVDYHEVTPLGFVMDLGEFGVFGTPSYVTNPDETQVDVWGIMSETGSITAKFYEPTFFEKVWEWIKEKIRFLIDLDNTIDGLLYEKVFNPADWYSEYKDIRDAEKKAKQAEKDAKKAEKEAAQVTG